MSKRRGPEEWEDKSEPPLFAAPKPATVGWEDHCGWCGLSIRANPKHDVEFCRRYAAALNGVRFPTDRYLDASGAPPVLGETYEPNADAARLGDQFGRVRALMEDGAWRTIQEISAATGDPEASASARLRDMRRAGYTVHRERVGPGRGTWRYRAERKIS